MVDALCSAKYFKPAGASSSAYSRQDQTYKSGQEITDPRDPNAKYIPGYYLGTSDVMLTGKATVSTVCNKGSLSWADGDVLDGPLHTNDALNIGGSVAFL